LTSWDTVAVHGRRSDFADVGLLAVAFAGAVVVRVGVAGADGAASIRAGLVFAAVLVLIAYRRCSAPRFGVGAIAIGVAGAAVLMLPVVVTAGGRGVTAPGGLATYASWGAATLVVATAEEAFLRGALFDALQRWRGSDVAVVGAAVAFAALHVPLYGWHVVPLDLAVGLGLGGLRLAAGTWTAPAIAHVGADLAGWWFV
jgi:membrane protease YdiL (CAAX protease family)